MSVAVVTVFVGFVVVVYRAQFMKEIRQLKEKGKPDGTRERSDGLVAAMKIQKVWRGFATRRKTRRGKLEEMYLIGMIPRQGPTNVEAIEAKEKRIQMRYKMQDIYNEEYKKILIQARDDITQKQGVILSQEIADEIRQWFRDYHVRNGKFPEYPSEDMGGSRHLLSRQGI